MNTFRERYMKLTNKCEYAECHKNKGVKMIKNKVETLDKLDAALADGNKLLAMYFLGKLSEYISTEGYINFNEQSLFIQTSFGLKYVDVYLEALNIFKKAVAGDN